MNRNARTLYLQSNKEELVKLMKRKRRRLGEKEEKRVKKLRVLIDWAFQLCLCQTLILRETQCWPEVD